jgi:hypothetical protein
LFKKNADVKQKTCSFFDLYAGQTMLTFYKKNILEEKSIAWVKTPWSFCQTDVQEFHLSLT